MLKLYLDLNQVNQLFFVDYFPVDSSEYQKLKDGLAKLKLNDSSFSFEPESSSALGLGFRCGFLGLLTSRNNYRKT